MLTPSFLIFKVPCLKTKPLFRENSKNDAMQFQDNAPALKVHFSWLSILGNDAKQK